MTDAVLVSVVIPANNAEAHLGQAIESVLGQTLPPEEVIIVDDGSTDATAEIAERFGEPVRCVRQPWSGVGTALNRGVEEAEGTLLAFLDADDLWQPDKQERQTRALADDSTLDMVFGQVTQFHSPELSASERDGLALPSDPTPGVCKGAMLIRREAAARVGPFDPQWVAGDFIEWYARAVDSGLRGAVMPEVVLRRRLHAEHAGAAKREGQKDYPRVLKTVLDRRRAEVE